MGGYPTLILFENGEAIGKHTGGRSLNDLLEFIKKNINEEGEGESRKETEEEEPPSDGDDLVSAWLQYM